MRGDAGINSTMWVMTPERRMASTRLAFDSQLAVSRPSLNTSATERASVVSGRICSARNSPS